MRVVETNLTVLCCNLSVLLSQTLLFPIIYLRWKEYQAMLIRKAKELKDGVVLAGDGRHDSMGH